MSVFIAGLGFGAQADILNNAKTGILLASALAGVAGYLWLRAIAPAQPEQNNRTDG
jgi:NhaA family Na+:H+ antiporter